MASHYGDVMMGAIASQITNLTIVCSTVYSDADQRKHQSSASLAFVRGIHRWPVNSPHKWPVTRKMFPFDDVIMLRWECFLYYWLFLRNPWVTDRFPDNRSAVWCFVQLLINISSQRWKISVNHARYPMIFFWLFVEHLVELPGVMTLMGNHCIINSCNISCVIEIDSGWHCKSKRVTGCWRGTQQAFCQLLDHIIWAKKKYRKHFILKNFQHGLIF